MARTKFSELRDSAVAKPGASERLAGLRAETLEEIRLYELRRAAAVSQAELAGRLEVTQGAISKLEHSDDVRVSTLGQYLEALGARLELVAVFDDEERRVPIHLGRDDAARTCDGRHRLPSCRLNGECRCHPPREREGVMITNEVQYRATKAHLER